MAKIKHDTQLIITPETKIAVLLEKYPQLEAVLMNMSPAYKKLQNPVLRRTVGKVASLSQVAKMGGFPIIDLVNALRKEVGQPEISLDTTGEAVSSDMPPDWVNGQIVSQTLDAQPLLDAGDTPIKHVQKKLKTLVPGTNFVLITPFPPVPMLDALGKQGFRVWCKEEKKELYKTYITAGKK